MRFLPFAAVPCLLASATARARDMEETAPGSQGLLVTLLVVAGAFFGISLFFGHVLSRANTRRRVTPTDDTGLRSVVTADAPFVKSAADAAQLVRRQLEAEGLACEDALDAPPDALVPVSLDDDPFVLRVQLADGRLVVRVCDRAAANRPAAESHHPPLPRKAARALLTRLDRAVRQASALADVHWYARERFDAGDRSAPAHDPLGD